MSLIVLTAVLFCAHPVYSHEVYPISPVAVDVKVEPDRIVADIEADSIYWIEEILSTNHLPPRNWPEPALRKAEDYLNSHLRLAVDHRPLPGRLQSADYIQRPWQVYEQGRVRFRMAYPPAEGMTLGGESDFYSEYRRELIEEHVPLNPSQVFSVHLRVSGRTSRSFDLNANSPSFQMPVSESTRSSLQMAFESIRVGLATVFGTIEGWPMLMALALSLSPGRPSRRRLISAVAGGIFGAMIAPMSGALPWSWIFGGLAALAAGRWFGQMPTVWMEPLSTAGVAVSWATESFTYLPHSHPGLAERAFSALGMLLAASAAIALMRFLINLQIQELLTHSQSRASELFDRRRRLAATILLIACAWGWTSRISL